LLKNGLFVYLNRRRFKEDDAGFILEELKVLFQIEEVSILYFICSVKKVLLTFLLFGTGIIYGQSGLVQRASCINVSKADLNLQLSFAKGTVLIFYSASCPICIKMTTTVNNLHAVYRDKGIVFLAVYPNTFDNARAIKKFHRHYKFKLPAVTDYEKGIVHRFSATLTPEVVFVDSNLNVLYSGKIDNWFEGIGVRRANITKHYLKDAIDRFLAGKEILIKKTEAVGCVIN
jgi:thiol-disulfide isomerase/thioredoxin